MKRPPHFFTLLITLTLCLLLQACGAVKLSYNNADTLIYWWLDGYVDFTPEQKPRVKDELLAFQQWHRKTQLPEFAAMAQTLQSQAAGEVSASQLCANFDRAQKLLPVMTAYLEPSVLWLVTQLTPDQIKSISDKYAKTNDKWREEWQPETKRELYKNMKKNVRERVENLYGKLSDEQKKMLREAVAALPYDSKMAYTERLRRQQDMLTTLKDIQSKKLAGPAAIDAAREPMRALLQRNSASPDAAYRAYFERYKTSQCEMFAKLHSSITTEQRAHAVSKLQDYERDFKTLQTNK
jgi:Family of unknown function (DUF6279)